MISNYDGSDSKPALEVGAEYHYPFSNRTQFSEEAIFTAVLDDGDDSYIFNNAMSLTYELTDEIDWENSWLFTHADYENTNDITTHSLNLSATVQN